mgnify:CR=1 FL=1
MIKYFDKNVELSEENIYYLVQSYGTVVLDDYDKVEFSDCCKVLLDFRTHYKKHIKICSKCGKDIKYDR